MPTKKKEPQAVAPDESAAYAAAIKDYSAALELLRKGDTEGAMKQFRAVQAAAPQEPELCDRAEIYAKICERKLAGEPAPSFTSVKPSVTELEVVATTARSVTWPGDEGGGVAASIVICSAFVAV